jgi:hypothetical protein
MFPDMTNASSRGFYCFLCPLQDMDTNLTGRWADGLWYDLPARFSLGRVGSLELFDDFDARGWLKHVKTC